ELTPDLSARINPDIPYLTNSQPSGEYVTEMMWVAGGVPMVQWYLRDYLDLDVLTVTGRTLGDNLERLHQSGFFTRNHGYLNN
ncbi:dihydroxy-acid dehydratase, partial [Salmonella enterica subsp. enterica serovar Infantis]